MPHCGCQARGLGAWPIGWFGAAPAIAPSRFASRMKSRLLERTVATPILAVGVDDAAAGVLDCLTALRSAHAALVEHDVLPWLRTRSSMPG